MKLRFSAPGSVIKAGLIAWLMLCASAALAQSYRIDLDTTALIGTDGYLNLQLNPADLAAPEAIADVTDLLGSISLLAAPVIEGDVTGALPGQITLVNSTAFNDYFQSVQFGSAFSFVVEFSGDFASQASALGTSFALALYGADGSSPLLTTDVAGSLVRFELAASGITYATFPPEPGGVAIAQVTPVPLPAAAWLLISGLLGLGATHRTQRPKV